MLEKRQWKPKKSEISNEVDRFNNNITTAMETLLEILMRMTQNWKLWKHNIHKVAMNWK